MRNKIIIVGILLLELVFVMWPTFEPIEVKGILTPYEYTCIFHT